MDVNWPLNRKAAAELLTADGTCVTTVVVAATKLLGVSIAETELEVIAAGIESEIGQPLPEALLNKIAAWQVAVETPLFYNNPEVFLSTAHTLENGCIPDGLDFEEHDLHTMMWAMYEIGLSYGAHEPTVGPAVQRLLLEAAQAEGEELQPDNPDPWFEEHLRMGIAGLVRELSSIGVPPEAVQELMDL